MINRRKVLFVSGGLLVCFFAAAAKLAADGMVEESPGVSAAQQGIAPHESPRRTPAAGAPKPARAGNVAPLSEFELGRYQYCGDDKDCVLAINGCCDCVNGGIEVAVNKERVDAFRERFDCLRVSCGMKVADPPCGSGVVSCINHKCQYFDRRQTG